MIRAAVLALPFAVCLSAFADERFPSPIEPAGEGKLQCYSPDRAKKTCMSMAAYRKTAGGGFENPASALLAPNPVIVMDTVTPVTMRNGQICGFTRKADIDAASFTLNGVKADEATAARIRQAAAAQFAPMLDKEVCTAYTPRDGELIAKATLAGAPMPAAGQRVIWVSPADGYKVAP